MTEPTAEKRITELEIQLAHLQRHCDQLDEVVTQQASLLDRLSRQFKKVSQTLEDLKEKDGEEVDPLSEKPPHY